MAESGGSSTNSGVEYEHWVFVYFMVQMLSNDDDNTTITPQKVREERAIPGTEIRKVVIDDLVISNQNKTTHYTIKQNNTSAVWNVRQLKSAKIIDDLKKQHEETPERDLILLSQSGSPILKEFSRLSACSNRLEIESAFSKELLSQWDDLKSAFDYDDDKLLCLSKKVKINVIDEDFLKQSVESIFRLKFNTPDHYIDTLFTFAFSRSKVKLPTSRKEVISYLKERGIIEKSTISDEVILSSLQNSSNNLESSVSLFQFEHINRQSTKDVIHWVVETREWGKPNISKVLTLTGKAGMGKTTVLQDVLKELRDLEIPVLAIKADRISFNNSEELKLRLDLPDTVERIFARLSEIKTKSVLLIDQIDALSLTLSTDRTQLDNYKELIFRCQKLPNILVVVSCRTYDLNNSLDLNQYLTNQNIEVGKLSEEEIINVICQTGIDSSLLRKETLELLCTPLHLSIFVQLSKSDRTKTFNFTTLNELYDELLKRVVLTNSNRKLLSELIEKVSNLMYEKQTLRVGRALFESEYFDQLEYLFSNGILQESDNEVSFFHQTFFDYSLARNFVISGRSISEELLGDLQGLYQRPRIKAILDYLYQTDKDNFFLECDTFLFKPGYRIHIKYLILNVLGFLEDVDVNAKVLGGKILKDESLKIAFIKSIMTQNWITFLNQNINLELPLQPLHKAVYHVCHINGRKFPNQILELLDNHWNHLNDEHAIRCLLNCVSVENPKFHKLFTENKKLILGWDYLMYSILNSALEQGAYSFVSDQFCSFYEEINQFGVDLKGEYFGQMYHQVLEKLWLEAPEEGYKASKKLFLDICKYSQYETRIGRYITCEAYSDFYGVHKEHGDDHYWLYTWIIEHLSSFNQEDEIKDELALFLSFEFEISTCLVLEIIIQKPTLLSKKGYQLIFDFLLQFDELNSLLQYLVGEAINKIYPYLNKSEQDYLFKACMSVKDYFLSNNRKINKLLFLDRYNLISKIPEKYILEVPERKRQLQEFQRKFGVFEWKRPKGISCTISSGSIPLPEKAYKSMSNEELLSSFHKVGKVRRFGENQVTKYGHSDAFEKLCIAEPLKYISLVQKMISDLPSSNIDSIYPSKGVLGLLGSNLSSESAVQIVHLVLEKESCFTEDYYLVRMIEHFSQIGDVTKEMFSYLRNKIIQFSSKDEDSFSHVLDELFNWVNFEDYHEPLLDLTEIISKGSNEKMKLHLLKKIAWLNFIDKDTSLRIFIDLMNNQPSLEKYDYARGSIQFMANIDMQLLGPIIQKAMDEIIDEKIAEWYGQLVGILWIDDFDFSNELYSFAEAKSDSFKEGILSVSIEFVKVNPKDSIGYKRAMENIEKYLSEENQKMYNSYQSLILFLSKEVFSDFNEFLARYIPSKVRETKDRHRILNEKLFEAASNYPKECIRLCELDINLDSFSRQLTDHVSIKSVFEILVKAYNSLSSLYDNDLRDHTMNLMDKSLEVAMLNQTHELAKTFETISQNEQD